MKSIKISLIVIILLSTFGCARLLFDSDRQTQSEIHKMTLLSDNPITVSNISQTPNLEYFPDVSPDGQKYALVTELPSGQNQISTREMGGADTTLLYSSSNKLLWPRWSCQQDSIAFSELNGNQAKIFTISTIPGGAATQVTTPSVNQSDSGGHDFFEGGNKIVFARSRSAGNTWDLFYTNYDGSSGVQAITSTSSTNEILPVVSHDGTRLAYLSYIPLLAGWPELITIREIESWAVIKQITLQPPIGGRKIGAIDFTHDDKGLYVATKAEDVSATPAAKKYELYLVKGLEPDQEFDIKRLTTNEDNDHHPSAIPFFSYARCKRCVGIKTSNPIPNTPQFTIDMVTINAATLPNGDSAFVSVEDYSSPRDGINEIHVGWTEIDANAAEFASINFPAQSFGTGPTEVDVTAFHYNRMQLQAYDTNGNLLSSAEHTAGQRVNQTLTLSGGNISKIKITGAEIGITDICYRR